MEKMKRRPQSIRRAFVTAISVTLVAIFVCSAATFYGCWMIQKTLLPDSDEVWLQTRTTYADGTVSEGKQRFRLDVPAELSALVPGGGMQSEEEQVEYTIEKIGSSYAMLSPARRTVYRGTQIAMVALPLLYAIVGIAICAWWFYRKKIAPPIQILTDAIGHVQKNTLDFQIDCPGDDELGQLCEMFERMRRALYENNRKLWRTIEDQRVLQASVAHDLRNPIAILEGYIEYLQKKLPGRGMSREKLEHTLENMSATAKRLERYTDCMRDLDALQKIEVEPVCLTYPDDLGRLIEDLAMLFEQAKIETVCAFGAGPRTIRADPVLLARILENLFANSLRYARHTVRVSAAIEEGILSVQVEDDGPGFSQDILEKKARTFYSRPANGEHLGLGLATARILCQKQDGQLDLSNGASGGARVRVSIPLQKEEQD